MQSYHIKISTLVFEIIQSNLKDVVNSDCDFFGNLAQLSFQTFNEINKTSETTFIYCNINQN